MNDPNVFENPCPICKKKEATRLCDYVTKYIVTTIDFRATYETCDLPLCEDCASRYGQFDFCPQHEALFNQLKLPKELQRYANRAKFKNMWR
ncbi:hypothetical protein CAI16_05355 [Virgibacillus dokdonensis]|uniref:Uncharacterized protein n=1 Tax=Virgibacillus dokdonensis TaxID=302167 RepID=A0A3E0WTQ1_9BACI|nr:hypothetical protein [Virgibacillus dokdonensis]RFA36218.1 hypothetical protein CAI16_05355 [Virgibacillus dokdonensis]